MLTIFRVYLVGEFRDKPFLYHPTTCGGVIQPNGILVLPNTSETLSERCSKRRRHDRMELLSYAARRSVEGDEVLIGRPKVMWQAWLAEHVPCGCSRTSTSEAEQLDSFFDVRPIRRVYCPRQHSVDATKQYLVSRLMTGWLRGLCVSISRCVGSLGQGCSHCSLCWIRDSEDCRCSERTERFNLFSDQYLGRLMTKNNP